MQLESTVHNSRVKCLTERSLGSTCQADEEALETILIMQSRKKFQLSINQKYTYFRKHGKPLFVKAGNHKSAIADSLFQGV